MDEREIFADNLRYYMERYGLSRNDLCKALDLKYTTVRDWEKGISYPRINHIRMLADYFCISKSDLIERKE